MNTDVATEKWSHQHVAYGPGWTQLYWSTRDHPSRAVICDTLKTISFTSLVELGCNSGPMLSVIHERFPKAKLTGVETNALAVEDGARLLPSATFALDSLMGWLPKQDARSYDVVLSYYTLAYVAPRDLPAVLWQTVRVAKRAVVLAEPVATPTEPPGMVYAYPEWRHDYVAAFRHLGWKAETHPLPRKDHLNELVVVKI